MQSSPHNITLFKPNLGRLVSPLAVLLPVSKHGWHALYCFTSWQARPLFSGSLGWRCNLTTSAAVVCLSCFRRWRCRWRFAVGVRLLWLVGALLRSLHLYITTSAGFCVASEKNFFVRRCRCCRVGWWGAPLACVRCACSLHLCITTSAGFWVGYEKELFLAFLWCLQEILQIMVCRCVASGGSLSGFFIGDVFICPGLFSSLVRKNKASPDYSGGLWVGVYAFLRLRFLAAASAIFSSCAIYAV